MFYCYLKYFTLLVCMSLFLAACLPGESETRSTLDNASQASVTVQAEKLASHLLTTATNLASTTAGSEVSDIVNQDLATIVCAGNQVVSYIPNTAKTSNNGTIPPAIAREMHGYLETRVGKDHVVSTENAPGCVNTELVATNSPIVVLNMAVAQIEEPQANQSEIIGVHMQPCPNNQPGVIITKTSLDGNSVTQNHCGTAAPAELPEIVLTEGKIADWQRRLAGPSGGSDPDAVRNFVCIAGDKGCDPIAPEMGTQIQCDDQDETVEYITNPVFNPQRLDGKKNYKFFPTASRDCNEHGWKGELIARVKSKNCQIMRNGKYEEIPAKVYDVAYVGAQCRKDQVLIEDLCPVGFPFSETGMMTSTKDIIMNAPIALQPHYDQNQGKNVSSVAYYNAGPNGIETNTDSVTLRLVNDGNTGRTRTQSVYGSKAMPLFMSTENLGPLTKTYDFDNSFTRQLSEAKKATEIPLICHALGQNCNPGNTPVMYAMVVDRSASMTAKTPDIVTHQTVCRATMADLFKKEQRVEACQAAKAWQKITNDKLAVREEMLDRWDARREPAAYGNYVYEQLINTADSFTQNALNREEMIMYNALRDKSKYYRMREALLKKQDCYPRQYNC